jgi:hypothetical protein
MKRNSTPENCTHSKKPPPPWALNSFRNKCFQQEFLKSLKYVLSASRHFAPYIYARRNSFAAASHRRYNEQHHCAQSALNPT